MTSKPINDPNEDLDLGPEAPAKPSKGGMAIVAVRLSRDLLARLSSYAKRRDMTMSDVLRQGAEQMVSGAVPTPHYVSGTVKIESPTVQSYPMAAGGGWIVKRDSDEAGSTQRP